MNPPDLNILTLSTARLTLEPITEEHGQELFELVSDQRLHTYVHFKTATIQDVRDRCARWSKRMSPAGDEVWLNWAARHRESGKMIAHFQAGYKTADVATVGYVVAKDCQGQRS